MPADYDRTEQVDHIQNVLVLLRLKTDPDEKADHLQTAEHAETEEDFLDAQKVQRQVVG